MCPACGEPMHPLALHLVAGVAFCRHCAAQSSFSTLKLSQLIRTAPFAQHVTNHAGILFYTPRTHNPAALPELARELHVEYMLALFPMTATGEHVYIDVPSTAPDLLPAATCPPIPTSDVIVTPRKVQPDFGHAS